MKKLSLLAFFLLSMPVFAADAPTCPEGPSSTSGGEPKAILTTTSKWKILVCGNKENRFGADIFTEFEIYATNGKAPVKLSLQTSPAAYYKIKKTPIGFTLVEQVLMDNYWLPVFYRDIKCTPKLGCRIKKEYCAHEGLRRKPKGVHTLITNYLKASKNRTSTGQATDEAEIDVVLAAAIGGNQEAIDAFIKNPGFMLDGASSEKYEYGKRLLRRLSSMKCKIKSPNSD